MRKLIVLFTVRTTIYNIFLTNVFACFHAKAIQITKIPLKFIVDSKKKPTD